MKKHYFKVLVPGILAAAALALAVGVGAQAPAAPPSVAKAPQAAPMAGHHMDSAAVAKHEADMKANHEAMMAKKQEMEEKHKVMEAKLDKLVAEMNAAKESKEPDALEMPMAAVINELVSQQKAFHAMMMESHSAMADRMNHHMEMQGTKGATEPPRMKMEKPAPKAEVKKP